MHVQTGAPDVLKYNRMKMHAETARWQFTTSYLKPGIIHWCERLFHRIPLIEPLSRVTDVEYIKGSVELFNELNGAAEGRVLAATESVCNRLAEYLRKIIKQ